MGSNAQGLAQAMTEERELMSDGPPDNGVIQRDIQHLGEKVDGTREDVKELRGDVKDALNEWREARETDQERITALERHTTGTLMWRKGHGEYHDRITKDLEELKTGQKDVVAVVSDLKGDMRKVSGFIGGVSGLTLTGLVTFLKGLIT